MQKFENIYWIGGSPCSGKSSIAEKIVDKYGFEYYKCDDYMWNHIDIGVSRNIPIMHKLKNLRIDELWLRNIEEMVDDEIEFYNEEFSIIEEELLLLPRDKNIIVEGAAIMPQIVAEKYIERDKYICIVPTREFQLEKYRLRKWIRDFLKGYSDSELAFSNWMDRDSKFADIVKEYSYTKGFEVLIVDGSKSLEENVISVLKHFNIV